ncbi:MAG TPA: hypothetical protein VEY12_08025, partial [Thermoplasmata archaeon]|nr:hypothetical protein [Thermoplasmata archaeon]
ELRTRYVFPFVDDAWTVAFVLVDATPLGVRILPGPLEVRPDGLHSAEPTGKLERIETTPLERFEELVHFDPWWTFRGAAAVDRRWVSAALASNIAGTFNHEGTTYKVHDLEFDPRLTVLEGLAAKDPVFRARVFGKGDLDLRRLRKPLRA